MKNIDNRSKTSAANGKKGGAPKIYDLEAADKIGAGARRCMEWLSDAAKTEMGKAALSGEPKDIARELIAEDPETRKRARQKCIDGALEICRRLKM